MTGPQVLPPPKLIFADDGAAPSDVAWAWLTGHRWDGWVLETVTERWTSVGGAELRPSRFVRRTPPSEAGFQSFGHRQETGDPRVFLDRQVDASLIVLGCHHRGHLAAMWAGSTAEWLLRRPPAPILLARHGFPTESVAVCLDGGPDARHALEALLSMPWAADVTVQLASVADGTVDVESALAQAAEAFSGRARVAGATALSGPRKQAIVDFVRSRDVDLVVMGTRGLTGARRMRAASTVSATLKHTQANILVAHDPGPAAATAT